MSFPSHHPPLLELAPCLYRSWQLLPEETREPMWFDWWSDWCFILLVCTEGTAVIRSPGQPTVSIAAGEAAIGDPGTTVIGNPRSRLVSLAVDIVRTPGRRMGLTPDGKAFCKPDPEVIQPSWRTIFGFAVPGRIDENRLPGTATLFMCLAEVCSGPGQRHLDGCLAFAGWLQRAVEALRPPACTATPTDDLAAAVDTLIFRHLVDGIRVADIAAALGCSRGSLVARYRAARGTTVIEAIARERLRRAMIQLASPSPKRPTIAALSRWLGMHNAEAFSTWFRHRTGLSPRAWRVQHRRTAAMTGDATSTVRTAPRSGRA